MKRLLLLAALLTLSAVCSAQYDYKDVHPRLIFSDEAFAKLRADIAKGDNDVLNILHECEMKLADAAVAEDSLVYRKDASNKRILAVSRSAVWRIFSQSYAYRYTGDRKYLEGAERDIRTVCVFPNWNPSHFLDVGEMAAAVGFGYDWLYSDLQEDTKERVRNVIYDYAFRPACDVDGDAWFYGADNNWNQVCNGGLVCAALGIMAPGDSCATRIIDDAIRTNTRAAAKMYAPDGNYPEGPAYWGYGTLFQVLLNTCLESVLGQDYGISEVPGFLKTGKYESWSNGPAGRRFNFSDNDGEQGVNNPLWYFAWKTGDTSLVTMDADAYRAGYRSTDKLIILAILYADKIGPFKAEPSKGRVYSGQGETPIAICRTGIGGDDLYLGVKGGKAKTNHGHMDVGSFVYAAYGVNWVIDLNHVGYATSEKELGLLDGSLWNMEQNSMRWTVPSYNNRWHSTLTVNDRDHDVDGFASIDTTFDTGNRLGASLDITKALGGELESAVRTATICDDSYLEVKDEVRAAKKKDAHIRFSLTSEAKPEIKDDCIVLTKDGVSVEVRVTGADVKFQTWPIDPYFKAYLCGYSYDLKGGKKATVVTTLKKL